MERDSDVLLDNFVDEEQHTKRRKTPREIASMKHKNLILVYIIYLISCVAAASLGGLATLYYFNHFQHVEIVQEIIPSASSHFLGNSRTRPQLRTNSNCGLCKPDMDVEGDYVFCQSCPFEEYEEMILQCPNGFDSLLIVKTKISYRQEKKLSKLLYEECKKQMSEGSVECKINLEQVQPGLRQEIETRKYEMLSLSEEMENNRGSSLNLRHPRETKPVDEDMCKDFKWPPAQTNKCITDSDCDSPLEKCNGCIASQCTCQNGLPFKCEKDCLKTCIIGPDSYVDEKCRGFQWPPKERQYCFHNDDCEEGLACIGCTSSACGCKNGGKVMCTRDCLLTCAPRVALPEPKVAPKPSEETCVNWVWPPNHRTYCEKDKSSCSEGEMCRGCTPSRCDCQDGKPVKCTDDCKFTCIPDQDPCDNFHWPPKNQQYCALDEDCDAGQTCSKCTPTTCKCDNEGKPVDCSRDCILTCSGRKELQFSYMLRNPKEIDESLFTHLLKKTNQIDGNEGCVSHFGTCQKTTDCCNFDGKFVCADSWGTGKKQCITPGKDCINVGQKCNEYAPCCGSLICDNYMCMKNPDSVQNFEIINFKFRTNDLKDQAKKEGTTIIHKFEEAVIEGAEKHDLNDPFVIDKLEEAMVDAKEDFPVDSRVRIDYMCMKKSLMCA